MTGLDYFDSRAWMSNSQSSSDRDLQRAPAVGLATRFRGPFAQPIRVPVRPSMPSLALVRSVISVIRPGLDAAK